MDDYGPFNLANDLKVDIAFKFTKIEAPGSETIESEDMKLSEVRKYFDLHAMKMH